MSPFSTSPPPHSPCTQRNSSHPQISITQQSPETCVKDCCTFRALYPLSFSHRNSMAPARSHFSNRPDSFRSSQLLFSLPEMSPFNFAFQQVSNTSFQLQVICYPLCNPWMPSINSKCRASHIIFSPINYLSTHLLLRLPLIIFSNRSKGNSTQNGQSTAKAQQRELASDPHHCCYLPCCIVLSWNHLFMLYTPQSHRSPVHSPRDTCPLQLVQVSSQALHLDSRHLLQIQHPHTHPLTPKLKSSRVNTLD